MAAPAGGAVLWSEDMLRPPDPRVKLFPELMAPPRVLAFVRPSYRSIGMLGGCQSPPNNNPKIRLRKAIGLSFNLTMDTITVTTLLKEAMEAGDTTAVRTMLRRVIKALEPPSHSGSGGSSSAIVDSSSSHQHWEPTKGNYLTLAVLVKECPAVLRVGFAPHSSAQQKNQPPPPPPQLQQQPTPVEQLGVVLNRLVYKWLKPGLPCGLSNALLACSILTLALRHSPSSSPSLLSSRAGVDKGFSGGDQYGWPTALVEAYVSDTLEGGSHQVRWSEHPDASAFVRNIRTAWGKPSPEAAAVVEEGQHEGCEAGKEWLRSRFPAASANAPFLFLGSSSGDHGSSSRGSSGGGNIGGVGGAVARPILFRRLMALVRRRLAILEAANTSAGCGGALLLLKEWVPLTGSDIRSGGEEEDEANAAEMEWSWAASASLGAEARAVAARHLSERWLLSAAVLDRAVPLLVTLAPALHAAAYNRWVLRCALTARHRQESEKEKKPLSKGQKDGGATGGAIDVYVDGGDDDGKGAGGSNVFAVLAQCDDEEEWDREAVEWLVDRMRPLKSHQVQLYAQTVLALVTPLFEHANKPRPQPTLSTQFDASPKPREKCGIDDNSSSVDGGGAPIPCYRCRAFWGGREQLLVKVLAAMLRLDITVHSTSSSKDDTDKKDASSSSSFSSSSPPSSSSSSSSSSSKDGGGGGSSGGSSDMSEIFRAVARPLWSAVGGEACSLALGAAVRRILKDAADAHVIRGTVPEAVALNLMAALTRLAAVVAFWPKPQISTSTNKQRGNLSSPLVPSNSPSSSNSSGSSTCGNDQNGVDSTLCSLLERTVLKAQRQVNEEGLHIAPFLARLLSTMHNTNMNDDGDDHDDGENADKDITAVADHSSPSWPSSSFQHRALTIARHILGLRASHLRQWVEEAAVAASGGGEENKASPFHFSLHQDHRYRHYLGRHRSESVDVKSRDSRSSSSSSSTGHGHASGSSSPFPSTTSSVSMSSSGIESNFPDELLHSMNALVPLRHGKAHWLWCAELALSAELRTIVDAAAERWLSAIDNHIARVAQIMSDGGGGGGSSNSVTDVGFEDDPRKLLRTETLRTLELLRRLAMLSSDGELLEGGCRKSHNRGTRLAAAACWGGVSFATLRRITSTAANVNALTRLSCGDGVVISGSAFSISAGVLRLVEELLVRAAATASAHAAVLQCHRAFEIATTATPTKAVATNIAAMVGTGRTTKVAECVASLGHRAIWRREGGSGVGNNFDDTAIRDCDAMRSLIDGLFALSRVVLSTSSSLQVGMPLSPSLPPPLPLAWRRLWWQCCRIALVAAVAPLASSLSMAGRHTRPGYYDDNIGDRDDGAQGTKIPPLENVEKRFAVAMWRESPTVRLLMQMALSEDFAFPPRGVVLIRGGRDQSVLSAQAVEEADRLATAAEAAMGITLAAASAVVTAAMAVTTTATAASAGVEAKGLVPWGTKSDAVATVPPGAVGKGNDEKLFKSSRKRPREGRAGGDNTCAGSGGGAVRDETANDNIKKEDTEKAKKSRAVVVTEKKKEQQQQQQQQPDVNAIYRKKCSKAAVLDSSGEEEEKKNLLDYDNDSSEMLGAYLARKHNNAETLEARDTAAKDSTSKRTAKRSLSSAAAAQAVAMVEEPAGNTSRRSGRERKELFSVKALLLAENDNNDNAEDDAALADQYNDDSDEDYAQQKREKRTRKVAVSKTKGSSSSGSGGSGGRTAVFSKEESGSTKVWMGKPQGRWAGVHDAEVARLQSSLLMVGGDDGGGDDGCGNEGGRLGLTSFEAPDHPSMSPSPPHLTFRQTVVAVWREQQEEVDDEEWEKIEVVARRASAQELCSVRERSNRLGLGEWLRRVGSSHGDGGRGGVSFVAAAVTGSLLLPAPSSMATWPCSSAAVDDTRLSSFDALGVASLSLRSNVDAAEGWLVPFLCRRSTTPSQPAKSALSLPMLLPLSEGDHSEDLNKRMPSSVHGPMSRKVNASADARTGSSRVSTVGNSISGNCSGNSGGGLSKRLSSANCAGLSAAHRGSGGGKGAGNSRSFTSPPILMQPRRFLKPPITTVTNTTSCSSSFLYHGDLLSAPPSPFSSTHSSASLSTAALEAGAWSLNQLMSTLGRLPTDMLLHLLLKASVATESINMMPRLNAAAPTSALSLFLPPVALVKEDDLSSLPQQQQHNPPLSLVISNMVAQCDNASSCVLDKALGSLMQPLSAELRRRFSSSLLPLSPALLAPLLHELSRSTATPDRRAASRLLWQFARAPQSSSDVDDSGSSGGGGGGGDDDDRKLADGGWGSKWVLEDLRNLRRYGALKSTSDPASTLTLKECVAISLARAAYGETNLQQATFYLTALLDLSASELATVPPISGSIPSSDWVMDGGSATAALLLSTCAIIAKRPLAAELIGCFANSSTVSRPPAPKVKAVAMDIDGDSSSGEEEVLEVSEENSKNEKVTDESFQERYEKDDSWADPWALASAAAAESYARLTLSASTAGISSVFERKHKILGDGMVEFGKRLREAVLSAGVVYLRSLEQGKSPAISPKAMLGGTRGGTFGRGDDCIVLAAGLTPVDRCVLVGLSHLLDAAPASSLAVATRNGLGKGTLWAIWEARRTKESEAVGHGESHAFRPHSLLNDHREAVGTPESTLVASGFGGSTLVIQSNEAEDDLIDKVPSWEDLKRDALSAVEPRHLTVFQAQLTRRMMLQRDLEDQGSAPFREACLSAVMLLSRLVCRFQGPSSLSSSPSSSSSSSLPLPSPLLLSSSATIDDDGEDEGDHQVIDDIMDQIAWILCVTEVVPSFDRSFVAVTNDDYSDNSDGGGDTATTSNDWCWRLVFLGEIPRAQNDNIDDDSENYASAMCMDSYTTLLSMSSRQRLLCACGRAFSAAAKESGLKWLVQLRLSVPAALALDWFALCVPLVPPSDPKQPHAAHPPWLPLRCLRSGLAVEAVVNWLISERVAAEEDENNDDTKMQFGSSGGSGSGSGISDGNHSGVERRWNRWCDAALLALTSSDTILLPQKWVREQGLTVAVQVILLAALDDDHDEHGDDDDDNDEAGLMEDAPLSGVTSSKNQNQIKNARKRGRWVKRLAALRLLWRLFLAAPEALERMVRREGRGGRDSYERGGDGNRAGWQRATSFVGLDALPALLFNEQQKGGSGGGGGGVDGSSGRGEGGGRGGGGVKSCAAKVVVSMLEIPPVAIVAASSVPRFVSKPVNNMCGKTDISGAVARRLPLARALIVAMLASIARCGGGGGGGGIDDGGEGAIGDTRVAASSDRFAQVSSATTTLVQSAAAIDRAIRHEWTDAIQSIMLNGGWLDAPLPSSTLSSSIPHHKDLSKQQDVLTLQRRFPAEVSTVAALVDTLTSGRTTGNEMSYVGRHGQPPARQEPQGIRGSGSSGGSCNQELVAAGRRLRDLAQARPLLVMAFLPKLTSALLQDGAGSGNTVQFAAAAPAPAAASPPSPNSEIRLSSSCEAHELLPAVAAIFHTPSPSLKAQRQQQQPASTLFVGELREEIGGGRKVSSVAPVLFGSSFNENLWSAVVGVLLALPPTLLFLVPCTFAHYGISSSSEGNSGGSDGDSGSIARSDGQNIPQAGGGTATAAAVTSTTASLPHPPCVVVLLAALVRVLRTQLALLNTVSTALHDSQAGNATRQPSQAAFSSSNNSNGSDNGRVSSSSSSGSSSGSSSSSTGNNSAPKQQQQQQSRSHHPVRPRQQGAARQHQQRLGQAEATVGAVGRLVVQCGELLRSLEHACPGSLRAALDATAVSITVTAGDTTISRTSERAVVGVRLAEELDRLGILAGVGSGEADGE